MFFTFVNSLLRRNRYDPEAKRAGIEKDSFRKGSSKDK